MIMVYCTECVKSSLPTLTVTRYNFYKGGSIFMIFFTVNRVRTDPGKVWKVMEFKVEIFQVWKMIENDLRYGKVMENVTADLKN